MSAAGNCRQVVEKAWRRAGLGARLAVPGLRARIADAIEAAARIETDTFGMRDGSERGIGRDAAFLSRH